MHAAVAGGFLQVGIQSIVVKYPHMLHMLNYAAVGKLMTRAPQLYLKL